MVYIFTWEHVRQLAGMNGNGRNITFKYNHSGIRKQKIVGTVKTDYHLVGSKVTYEDNGTEVVSYSYDAFGKLTPSKAEMDDANDNDKNGITGSLATTVGVKNPYLYRGYRYDSETGLYYLQSRYYNPSWGRFLNADAIIGSVGELLGHNVFAYCKNNVVNGKDPSGFITIYTQDEPTDEMVEAGYKAMNTAAKNRSSNSSIKSNGSSSGVKNNNVITKKELIDMGKSVAKNAGAGYVGYLAANVSEPSMIAFNRQMERAGQFLLIPGSRLAKGIGMGLAIFGVVDTISTLVDDWNDSRSWQERTGKIAIDGGVFIFSAIAGAVGSPATGAVIGLGLSTIGDAAKNYLWDN